MKSLFSLLLLAYATFSFADCTINGTVLASNDPFNGCSGVITITGTLDLDTDYDISSLGDIELVLDGGTIEWSGNNDFALSAGSSLELINGGELEIPSGGCNSQKTMTFGGTTIATCNGNGSSLSFAEVNAMGGYGLLPVELTSFSVVQKSNIVEITWSTASEINNERFEVMHSTDGRLFESIGSVDGFGTTIVAQNYSLIHKDYSKGNNYYKLKQIDFNGDFEYSNIQSISILSSIDVTVFPNPTTETVQLAIPSDQTINLVTIFNTAGKVMKSWNQPTKSLEISDLENGYYIISVEINGQMNTFPLIVTK